jgi:hypothetical protein
VPQGINPKFKPQYHKKKKKRQKSGGSEFEASPWEIVHQILSQKTHQEEKKRQGLVDWLKW